MKRSRLYHMALVLVVFSLAASSCDETTKGKRPKISDFDNRAAEIKPSDSLQYGSTYLSVYSQIYSFSENAIHDLTATVSFHNTRSSENIIITKADYFNTDGDIIKSYVNNPVYIRPLETLQIVIAEEDEDGGTGGNFIFDWAKAPETSEPLFEAVMISTVGQQGLSFTTTGKRIK